jgi:hypothetical protein
MKKTWKRIRLLSRTSRLDSRRPFVLTPVTISIPSIAISISRSLKNTPRKRPRRRLLRSSKPLGCRPNTDRPWVQQQGIHSQEGIPKSGSHIGCSYRLKVPNSLRVNPYLAVVKWVSKIVTNLSSLRPVLTMIAPILSHVLTAKMSWMARSITELCLRSIQSNQLQSNPHRTLIRKFWPWATTYYLSIETRPCYSKANTMSWMARSITELCLRSIQSSQNPYSRIRQGTPLTPALVQFRQIFISVGEHKIAKY